MWMPMAMMMKQVINIPVIVGNMWTANLNSSSVSKITPTWTITTYTGTLDHPYWIAFDWVNMWTANYFWTSVSKITPTWTITTYTGTWYGPYWIAFDWVLLSHWWWGS